MLARARSWQPRPSSFDASAKDSTFEPSGPSEPSYCMVYQAVEATNRHAPHAHFPFDASIARESSKRPTKGGWPLTDQADASIPPVDGFKRTAASPRTTRGQLRYGGVATGSPLMLFVFPNLHRLDMVTRQRVMLPPLRKHESHARWDSAAPRLPFGITGRRPHGTAWTKNFNGLLS